MSDAEAGPADRLPAEKGRQRMSGCRNRTRETSSRQRKEGRQMQLNHREYAGFREGLTVQDVIDENRFTWPKLVVKCSGTVIWPQEYASTVLKEDDDLEIIHLLGGG